MKAVENARNEQKMNCLPWIRVKDTVAVVRAIYFTMVACFYLAASSFPPMYKVQFWAHVPNYQTPAEVPDVAAWYLWMLLLGFGGLLNSTPIGRAFFRRQIEICGSFFNFGELILVASVMTLATFWFLNRELVKYVHSAR